MMIDEDPLMNETESDDDQLMITGGTVVQSVDRQVPNLHDGDRELGTTTTTTS